MDDLIRRQDVITALRQAKVFGHPDALTAINHIPAIDAVPVIRCGDCKWYYTSECQIKMSNYGLKYDDYCSYGERKTNNG